MTQEQRYSCGGSWRSDDSMVVVRQRESKALSRRYSEMRRWVLMEKMNRN
ncbi:hypothetical protein A2U01_0044142 [Trifolium medium]|uniref:Uncharacterized protein n=1 Tax=Trifolium medium TaxID=97028 RepID=A0A392QGH5_9FABA|nr:hypothetical protein [Trifolium medium]